MKSERIWGSWVLTSELVPLSKFCKVQKGLSYKGEFIHQEGPALLGIGTIKEGGGFRPENVRTYGGPYKKEHVLNPGDVYVALTSQDGFLIGSPAKVPHDFDGFGITTHHDAKIDWKEADEEIREYLYWVMHTYHFIRHCQNFSVGTTVYTTHPRDVERFLVPNNPSKRQRTFASTLKQISQLKRTLNAINSNFESLISTLFRSWFIDFDPVKAKAEGKLPYGMDEETASLFPDSFEDSELGPIPTGWNWGKLGNCISVVGGGTPSTKNEAFWDGKYNWTSPKDLSNSNSIIMLDTERTITEAGLAKISSGLLPVDTVLMSSRAPIGYLALTKIPVAINQGYIAIPPVNCMSPNFMLYWIHFNMPLIEAYSSGSTFPEISKKEFRKLLILIPPSELIEKFNEKTTRLYDSMETSLKQMNSLISIRDALLPRLMSGELIAN